MVSGALERFGADSARRWIGQATVALERARAQINALNVFPVPDRDTGTNMAVTLRSAAASAEATAGSSTFLVADAAAAGALSGACGSSGVILASYMRGFADALRGRDDADAPRLAAALAGAADAAYAAVSEPLEGTILSVARAAAVAARDQMAAVAAAAVAAAAGARAELSRTTARVPALAAADVVDAGGQGLVVVLDVLADITSGVPSPASRAVATNPVTGPATPTPLRFAYEVQYLLEAPSHALPTLRLRLEQLGDAVAVVTGTDRHNVHVHVNDVDAAIEAALDLGRPSDIRVTNLDSQITSGLE